MFLSDFRPREEYFVLLNDESSTIKRFGKMLKSSMLFYESVWSKFSFFHFPFFSRFLIDLKRRPNVYRSLCNN